MKKFTKLCCLVLCIALVGLVSCKSDDSTPTSESKAPQVSVIEELRVAIKKNPYEYNNKTVSIKGTISIEDSKTILYDYHYNVDSSESKGSYVTGEGLMSEVQFRAEVRTKPSIEVVLLNNLQSYVVESWDYVEVTGVIKITSEKIYLDKCTCTIIFAHEER